MSVECYRYTRSARIGTDMDTVTVRTKSEVETSENADDVSRQVAFETADTIMVRSLVSGGVTTGWHHNADRHVYGFVVHGRAILEYGPGGKNTVALDAGSFVYVPPRTIRRVVNPSDDDWEIVISFVGAGPPAVAVDGPEPEDE